MRRRSCVPFLVPALLTFLSLGVEAQVVNATAAAPAPVGPGATAPRMAEITGTVIDGTQLQPLAEAEVLLPMIGRTTLTGAQGEFRFADIPAGDHRVIVRKVGYSAVDTTVTVDAEVAAPLRFALRRTAVLDTVRVRAASLIPSFDEHRALGRGHFVTRDELARMADRPMSSVLADFPAARLVPIPGSSGSMLASRRRGAATYRRVDPQTTGRVMQQGACPATVYLNGSMAYRGLPGEPPFDVNSLNPESVEAIEFYAGPNEVPPRYAGRQTDCGVLVIHTRRARR